MARLAFLLGFLSLCGCSSFLHQDGEAAQLHLQIGTSHLNNGDYPRALNELLIAESLDRENPIIQNNLGLAYFVRNRFDLAELHIRKAISLNEKFSDARNNLGRVLIERGKYQEAIVELRRVINDLTYTSPEKPLTNYGMAQFYLKEFAAARKTLSRAIELQRDNCLALAFYGRTFFEERDYARAAESLDRAAGFCVRTQYDEPVFYSGLAYRNLGDADKAENRLETVIKVYPQGRYVEQARQALQTIRR